VVVINAVFQTEFNSITNYLVNSWVPKYGCLACRERTLNLDASKVKKSHEFLLLDFGKIQQELEVL
jgi:hypothetical protein